MNTRHFKNPALADSTSYRAAHPTLHPLPARYLCDPEKILNRFSKPTLTMQLNYLDFEYSEDADGNGTLDAMASALPPQLPALQGEITGVLAWAHAHWPGTCAPLEDGGSWHFDLQGVQEVQSPLDLAFDEVTGQLRVAVGNTAPPRTTLTLTLSGSSDFCAALREAFDMG